MAHTYQIQEVFIPVGLPELTFIVRPEIERSIKSWEMNKHKHLLIFGASKTGKTSLWKRYVALNNVIKIACNSNTNIESTYLEILEQIGAYFVDIETEEKGNSEKNALLVEIKALIPWIGVNAKAQGEKETSKKQTRTKEFYKTKITSNQLIKYLKKAKKIIVLEDFHYTDEEFRNQLSEDLKAFSDESCPWIIVGVQHKTSNLLSFNIDLSQRISEIPVENFTESQLEEIIELGELALNIKIENPVKEKIIQESSGSASLLQNICQRICMISKVYNTQDEVKIIGGTQIVEQACKEIANENRSFYEKVFAEISRGGRSDGSTEKYKWFIKVIANKEIPERGIKNTEMLHFIRDLGNSEIDQGSVTGGLNYLPKLLKKNNLPALMDYAESTKTFYLLDNYMKFVMKWAPETYENIFES